MEPTLGRHRQLGLRRRRCGHQPLRRRRRRSPMDRGLQAPALLVTDQPDETAGLRMCPAGHPSPDQHVRKSTTTARTAWRSSRKIPPQGTHSWPTCASNGRPQPLLPGAADVRVVNMRTSPVLGKDGGSLPKLALLTRLWLGGTLGSGKQYFPWISVTDQVAAVTYLLTHPVSGPVNVTAPYPVTNEQFTKELGKALHRPAPWIIPGFALHIVLGEFAERNHDGPAGIADRAARVRLRVHPPHPRRRTGRRTPLTRDLAVSEIWRCVKPGGACSLANHDQRFGHLAMWNDLRRTPTLILKPPTPALDHSEPGEKWYHFDTIFSWL